MLMVVTPEVKVTLRLDAIQGAEVQAYLSSPYSVCSVRTARSVWDALINTENLISEVVMARILIFCCDSALNALAATPAWLRMPTPITDTLATLVAPSSRS